MAALAALTGSSVWAQKTYTANFPNGGEKILSLAVNNGDITVRTHDQNTVIIEINGDDWEDPREDDRAQGLTMISAEGTDNTSVGLFESKEGNVLSFTQLSKRNQDFEILVPKDASVRLKEMGWIGSTDFIIEGVGGEIEVDAKNGDVIMKDIGGPIVVTAMNGDVDVIFSEVSQKGPMSVNATNGAIDITFPASSKGDLQLRSMNGELFTDLDINITKKGSGWGSSVDGTLNGGGVSIDLSAMNGNIFLRKK
ncbi:MAG TPA: hypothetical protein DCE41_09370 [Cytophagales bacterium]|nr:hypothetical protein [Cytophagales bacterium]